MDKQLHDEPSSVSAEAGQVMVDGPGGVIVDLTPNAAEETARRLHEAAGEARRQVAPSGNDGTEHQADRKQPRP